MNKKTARAIRWTTYTLVIAECNFFFMVVPSLAVFYGGSWTTLCIVSAFLALPIVLGSVLITLEWAFLGGRWWLDMR